MASSEMVRADDLLAPLAELHDRDFLESLPQKARTFIEKFDRQFREDSLYYRQTLINETFVLIDKALVDLEDEFSDLPMTVRIGIVFNNYKQLIMLFKTERQRLVSAFKEFAELMRDEAEAQEESGTEEGVNAESG